MRVILFVLTIFLCKNILANDTLSLTKQYIIVDSSRTNADLYAPGQVAFELQDTVSLEYFAAYIYSLSDIFIDKIVSFEYTCSLSQDSVKILKSVLESKSYIDGRSGRISYIENGTEIIVRFWIRDFRSEYQSDWLSTINQFNLTHYPNHFPHGILKVESGKEKEWIDYFSTNEVFRFVKPNYIIRQY